MYKEKINFRNLGSENHGDNKEGGGADLNGPEGLLGGKLGSLGQERRVVTGRSRENSGVSVRA